MVEKKPELAPYFVFEYLKDTEIVPSFLAYMPPFVYMQLLLELNNPSITKAVYTHE